jgi:hypothetical protein
MVCTLCLEQLVADLRSLPALYDDCIDRSAPGTLHVIRNGPRKSPGTDPISPAAAELRAAIRTVLASWASLVAQERRLRPPARDIRTLARFLGRHAEWLAAHPAASELVDEVRELARSARKSAHTNGRGRVPVGTCPTCNGELVALMRRSDDPKPSEIVCTAFPEHAWPATRWATLARQIRGRQRRIQGG